MMSFVLTFIAALLGLSGAHSELCAAPKNRYTQLVLPFPNERIYSFYYNTAKNSIVLDISKTSADEIPALLNYDETLVRRLLIKEKDASSTQVTMVLRDSNVRATITSFQEPFRIVIDLFDHYYRDHRDAKTGFPFTTAENSPSQQEDGFVGDLMGDRGHQPGQGLPLVKESPNYSRMPLKPHPTPMRDSSGQRKLLQPPAEPIADVENFTHTIKQTPPGRGGAWQRFPIYIYRIQLESYKTGKSYKDFINKNSAKAVSSMYAMADYAGKLFDFGHEGRALTAYKQVVLKAPLIFDKAPIHLWRLAEIHLGQGNLTLADGYFQAMIEKHPDHPLSRYARVRRIDIQAIRAIAKSDIGAFAELSQKLEKVNPYKDIELKAQIALRRVYWSQPEDIQNVLLRNRYFIPPLTPANRAYAQSSYRKVEIPWTGFLLATQLLNDRLKPGMPWSSATAKLSDHYFKNYKGKKLEPYRSNLKEKMTNVLNKLITDFVEKEDYLSAVKVYESLSPELKKFSRTARCSWSIAQAYRLLGQSESAIPFYKEAQKNLEDGKNKFKALYWLTISTSDAIDTHSTGPGRDSVRISRLQKDLGRLDKQTYRLWNKLKAEERHELLVAMKSSLDQAVKSQILIQTPALILFDGWSKSLTIKEKDATSKLNDIKSSFTPDSKTVGILISLEKKFEQLSNEPKRVATLRLLSLLGPKSFGNDKTVEITWAEKLVELAEYYRKANKDLDAGRIYALTGTKSANWEGRAEALYKGGLLLYRSGRREEAMKAFTSASQDGNNLIYAELAKKRLEMINR